MNRAARPFAVITLSFWLATSIAWAGEKAVKESFKLKIAPNTSAQDNSKRCAAGCALTTKRAKVSYAIGVDIGENILRNLNPEELNLNVDGVIKGFSDVLEQRQLHLSDAERELFVERFFKELKAKEVEKERKCAEENKQAGVAFLAKNKQQQGVITLASGVQYKIIKPGTGKKPQKNSLITVHYRGTFIDGKVFGQTSPNAPVALNMAGPDRRPIDGWMDVLPLMAEGAKWTVYIPAEKAYGETGHRTIPPYSALIFDIELIKVNPPKTTK